MNIHKTFSIDEKLWIACISVTKDNKYIIIGSFDKLVRIWNLEKGICIKVLKFHTDIVWSIC